MLAIKNLIYVMPFCRSSRPERPTPLSHHTTQQILIALSRSVVIALALLYSHRNTSRRSTSDCRMCTLSDSDGVMWHNYNGSRSLISQPQAVPHSGAWFPVPGQNDLHRSVTILPSRSCTSVD